MPKITEMWLPASKTVPKEPQNFHNTSTPGWERCSSCLEIALPMPTNSTTPWTRFTTVTKSTIWALEN